MNRVFPLFLNKKYILPSRDQATFNNPISMCPVPIKQVSYRENTQYATAKDDINSKEIKNKHKITPVVPPDKSNLEITLMRK